MNWDNELFNKNEKPLDKLVDGYSYTSVFRTMAFVKMNEDRIYDMYNRI